MKFVAFEERLSGLEGRHAARNPSRSLLSDLTDEELRKLKEIAVRTKNGTVDLTDEDDALSNTWQKSTGARRQNERTGTR